MLLIQKFQETENINSDTDTLEDANTSIIIPEYDKSSKINNNLTKNTKNNNIDDKVSKALNNLNSNSSKKYLIF